jgi:hypothetical protein
MNCFYEREMAISKDKFALCLSTVPRRSNGVIEENLQASISLYQTEASSQLHTSAALPPRESLRYSLDRRLRVQQISPGLGDDETHFAPYRNGISTAQLVARMHRCKDIEMCGQEGGAERSVTNQARHHSKDTPR